MHQKRSDASKLGSLNRAPDGVVHQSRADALQVMILVNGQAPENQNRYRVGPVPGHSRWGVCMAYSAGRSVSG